MSLLATVQLWETDIVQILTAVGVLFTGIGTLANYKRGKEIHRTVEDTNSKLCDKEDK